MYVSIAFIFRGIVLLCGIIQPKSACLNPTTQNICKHVREFSVKVWDLRPQDRDWALRTTGVRSLPAAKARKEVPTTAAMIKGIEYRLDKAIGKYPSHRRSGTFSSKQFYEKSWQPAFLKPSFFREEVAEALHSPSLRGTTSSTTRTKSCASASTRFVASGYS